MTVTRKAEKALRKAGLSRRSSKEVVSTVKNIAYDSTVNVTSTLMLDATYGVLNLAKAGAFTIYYKGKEVVKNLVSPKQQQPLDTVAVGIKLPTEDEVEE